MKKLMIISVAGAVLLLCTTGALANNRSQLVTPNLPSVGPGEIYDRSQIFQVPDGPPVALPSPIEPSGTNGTGTDQLLTTTGPLGFNDFATTGFGNGFVTPRGSTMSTPRMKADREIRRLIRSLN